MLANGYCGLELVVDGGVEGIFDHAVDYFMVAPFEHVGFVLGFDDGPVVFSEIDGVAGFVYTVVVGCSTGVGWVDVWLGFRHRIFGAIHEDSSVAHVGAIRIGDGDRLADAFVLEGTDGVDVWASDDFDEGAEFGFHVRVFEFDVGHDGVCSWWHKRGTASGRWLCKRVWCCYCK